MQTAAKLLLEPIFETDLDLHLRLSVGPGRDPRDQGVHALLRRGLTDVVDADLSKYFDRIPHRELMRSVVRRAVDRHVLRVIKLWLKIPVEERGGEGTGGA